MKCSKCGYELSDNANFCRNCGSPTKKKMNNLVERAKENDQEALTEIYEMSSPAVYRTIKVLIKEEDTVYDILQDTYIKAFTRLDQLQDSEKLIPWIKMIANNRAKDWLKKAKPVFFTDISNNEDDDSLSFEEAIEDVRSDMNPEMSMDEKEVHRLVMEILDQLPEDQRLVIGMFYYEEMSVKDISEILGVSENTVKSRLSYGRKKIKEQVLDLEKHGTKLYNVAPFVFFLYLLRKVDTVSAQPLNSGILQNVMEECGLEISRENFSDKKPETFENNSSNNKGETGKFTKTKGVDSAVKSGAAKAVGTTAGAIAKHTGIKIAALILAGTVGAGGLIYGVAKNTDKLPFVNEKSTKETSADMKKKSDAETTPKASVTPKLTATPELTATPVPTTTPEPTATPQPAENPSNYQDMPEYAKYQSFIQNFCANTEGDIYFALYDIDEDGIRELILSHGTSEADWKNEVYTLENDTNVISIGSIGGHVSLYTAPDGNGIYSTFGHMGYEKIDRFTKNGNTINQENIVDGREIGPNEDYTTFDREIKLISVSENTGVQQDQSGDSQETEGLNLIAGTWYTMGGAPYHFKAVFSGNTMSIYYPDSGEVNETRTVVSATKTDYGYFFQINDGSGYGDYGYRLDLSDTGTLTLVETTDPNSMDGYSATDSLVRNK